MKWEREHRGHNAVDLSESRETLKASLEDCVAKIESYRSALQEVPEIGTEWLSETDRGLRGSRSSSGRTSLRCGRHSTGRRRSCCGNSRRRSEYDATKQLICDAQERAVQKVHGDF